MSAPRPELVDIGVNLAHRSFAKDRGEVLARAAAAGVTRMVITGTSLPASRSAAWIAKDEPGRLWSTAGVHPHQAKEWDASSGAALCDLLAGAVAVGECGLDFDRNFSPQDAQRACFEAQLAIAAELGMPVFLHERRASEAFTEILRRWRPRIPRAVVHCFTGTREELERYLALDLHVGITGWVCDERRGAHLLELLPRVPLERLMLETDAPFLTPRTIKPPPAERRNEPAFLPEVLRVVARALGKPPAEVAAATTATARAFFGI